MEGPTGAVPKRQDDPSPSRGSGDVRRGAGRREGGAGPRPPPGCTQGLAVSTEAGRGVAGRGP